MMTACAGSSPQGRHDAAVDADSGQSLTDALSKDRSAAENDGHHPDGSDATTCDPETTSDGTCNRLDLVGATITSTCSSASVPQPIGGTIEEGAYVLTSMTYFGTCPAAGAEERATWAICGASWETVQELERVSGKPDAGIVTQRLGLSVTVAATSIAGDIGCWSATGAPPTAVSWGYDATPGHLALHIPVTPGVRVDSYSRQ